MREEIYPDLQVTKSDENFLVGPDGQGEWTEKKQ